MKSLVFNLTVAMVVLTNVSEGPYGVKREVKAFKNESPVSLLNNIHFFEEENFPNTTVSNQLKPGNSTAFHYMKNEVSGQLTSMRIEAAEGMFSNRAEKTVEEVITEDNAITENNVSNQTQALDFVAIENSLPALVAKTTDETIAEDNEMIENNVTNETQALDFNLIYDKPSFDVVIDNVAFDKSGRTMEEIIREDIQITEYKISDDTQALNLIAVN
ncbi:hypothetical protein [Flavobacterium sp.]|uniref:hypothetical protein n=1 Tax=Flavobacterium sp. TaxID=239 RepID=UPI003D6C5156